MSEELKSLKQRISILESTVGRLKHIAVANAEIVNQAQYTRHYCECGNDITDMHEICGTPECPHGLYHGE